MKKNKKNPGRFSAMTGRVVLWNDNIIGFSYHSGLLIGINHFAISFDNIYFKPTFSAELNCLLLKNGEKKMATVFFLHHNLIRSNNSNTKQKI